MKKLLVILLISLTSLTSWSQDTLHIPQHEIDEIIEVLDTLTYQDSINTILIGNLEEQVLNYEALAKQDSILLSFKGQQILLYDDQVKLYEQKIKMVDKWYNKRPFGFILGVATTVGLIHIINYTLPE